MVSMTCGQQDTLMMRGCAPVMFYRVGYVLWDCSGEEIIEEAYSMDDRAKVNRIWIARGNECLPGALAGDQGRDSYLCFIELFTLYESSASGKTNGT
jgi:hypothetical protein